MNLETAETISHTNVTEEQLLNAFQKDSARGEYIILSQDAHTYIQTAGEYDGPYKLEYQENDIEHHYQCQNKISKEQVQQAFIKYLKLDNSWKNEFEWKQLEIKQPWWKFW